MDKILWRTIIVTVVHTWTLEWNEGTGLPTVATFSHESTSMSANGTNAANPQRPTLATADVDRAIHSSQSNPRPQ